MGSASSRAGLAAVVLVSLIALTATTAEARQLRVSPGPLSRAHASLEGVTKCGQCHDSVQGVSRSACLTCHKPIGVRIAAARGVHRNATAGTCAKCHVEHGGVDADLRRLDVRTFQHAAETGFALEGEHAKLTARCAACHKKRSYIAARTACASCHADAHKATLGTSCTTCHSTAVPFKETRRQFDHARTKFALTGAHVKTACEKCHAGGVFRGVRFDTCSACHKPPHRRTLGPNCASCHVTDRWTATRSFEHARTAFSLTGAHVKVACASCHRAGVKVALVFDRCSACHANVHRDSVKGDCRTCHTETSFRPATFDHAARTSFPLAGRHEGLPCRKCHAAISADDVPSARKVVDFSGVQARCASCHKDPHKAQYGAACDSCHRTVTFKAAGFVHPRAPEFFAGRHRGVECVRCHVRTPVASVPLQPVAPTPVRTAVQSSVPSMACATCHADVHDNQVGTACERCHAVDAERFAPTKFSHDRASFPLTGKHQQVPCAKCHPAEPPRNRAVTVAMTKRLKATPTECAGCHKDPHLGQVAQPCASCHSTGSFAVSSYAHPGLEYTFGMASHDRLPCRSCHKSETRQYPAGWGTAVRLTVGRRCQDCHP